ncbi:MAG: hypothetical protein J7623_27550 [Chitinophaga sp.]|uniref:hypothetical protein n=1 Tax=Chitinophaga sp. TaxID=1869181 RepID=UPI001B16B4A5|nr:hypothetical protein [Chitinophaga sp.]MBO9732428.1 hypothetical protein [Chitinophaga sp.]
MKQLVLLFAILLFSVSLFAQAPKTVVTADIDHFWEAYDSIRSTSDSLQQLQYIQRLYIDKGTPGLLAFMKLKGYTAAGYVSLIRKYPAYWNSIRSNTLKVKKIAGEFEPGIKEFRRIYPGLKPATIYFTIGGMRSGGTAQPGMVLIGAEMVTGNAQTDVSELPEKTRKWLAGYYGTDPFKSVVLLNIHEYVHTQQPNYGYNLLSQCLCEGACDFITELVTGKKIPLPYMDYGKKEEADLKRKFKIEMFGDSWDTWLYNGGRASTVADLGYFIGYRICQSFYQQVKNKTQAVQEIIGLNFQDSTMIENFLQQSAYYPEGFNKAELLAALERKMPVVTNVASMEGKARIHAADTLLKIDFSLKMSDNGYSISRSADTTLQYPIKAVQGFSPDMQSVIIRVDLKPGTRYGFIMTDRSFRSAEGYPLKPYEVRFETAP